MTQRASSPLLPLVSLLARTKLRVAVVALLAGVAVVSSSTQAQRAAAPANFDVRTEKSADVAAYLSRFPAPASFADTAAARATGMARLQTDFPAVEVVGNPELGTPELVGVQPGGGFLTAPAGDRAAAMRGFLSAYADVYGLSQPQVASLALVADYANPSGNMAWVEFEQRVNGLPVFQGLIRGGFTAKGELARTTGPLAAGLDPGSLATSPSLTAAQAISRAASHVGWSVPEGALAQKSTDAAGRAIFDRGPMADDAKAWLLYFPLSPGVARLAWVTEIWGTVDVYMTALDAEDGTLLFRKNLTNYQTQSATYRVYNDDSPAPMSPSTTVPGVGAQAPMILRTLFTLIGNEGAKAFNNLGWMTDGLNVTDGNNVEAGLDRDGLDGVDAPIAGAARVFDFAINPGPGNPPPGDDPLTPAFQNAEVTDGFYWTNEYHDRLYLLGFTEIARNFQNDNFGRGGLALDRVRGEFQDSSGTNNANFSTPSDGGRGRMQMYLFTGPTPDRTSGLDHDVLIHELTHGTSNRLHNNGAGLSTTFSGGMGEGWSDFYARAILSSAAEDPNGIYSTGGWVTNQLTAGYVDNYYYGIRRFPYASRSTVGANGRPHNPLTFADVDPTQINTTDGAFPNSPVIANTAFQVHNIGQIWASALMEVRARFITRLGFALGNQRILQFVTDGMKLDPVNPHFLQGRDSIIAAANAGGGTLADINDIWAGFATRGMGASAQVLNAGTGSVIEAFDVPGIAAAGGTLVAESLPNGRLDPGETVTLSLCVTNNATVTSGSVTGTLQASGGVQAPSGPQVYGAVAPAGNVCRTYSLTVGAACGGTLTATLQAQEAGGLTRNLLYSFTVGSQAPFFSQNFDGVAAPGLPVGWTTSTLSGTANLWVTSLTTPDSAPNRAFASNLGTVSDSVLVSPSIAMPLGAATLSFRNHYNTETLWDGGVLEISINGGAFADIVTAGGTFTTGGYSGTLNAGSLNPLTGRQAWTGNSGTYVTTTLNMPPAAAGQNVVLRWRMGSDDTVGATGWAVDTISVFVYTCSNAAPVITTHPQSTTVMSGGTATLSVVAAGTAPLTYQWYQGNSPDTTTPIGGATSSSYTTPALVAPTSYWVRVSNIVGPANSNTANITIGPAAGAEMVANGNFSAGSANWSVFEVPDIISSVVGGVFQWYRANPTTTPSTQATVFQETFRPVAAGAALQASFRIGNSSTARKRISVLVIDSNFTDITVCTFWLPPGTPLTLYTMNTHSTKAWTNAAIYFYAATKGQDGGNYLLDDVSLTYQPAISNTRTDCIDPLAPAAPGGVNGPNLLVNGDFASGALAPWGTFGTITQQVVGNVLEFIRPSTTPPSGVVLQSTGQAMAANEIMMATFQLGNSSAVRKRVTVLLHDLAFGDLMACTFWVPPGQGLLPYSIKGYATVPWTNATMSVYPATTGMETWIRFDNASLFRAPTTAALGTECGEPVPTSTTALNGVIGTAPPGGSTGTLATRIFRPGTPSATCSGVTLPVPFNTGAGPFIYNVHQVVNPSATPLCMTVRLTMLTEGTAVGNLQLAAFQSPFAAADITNTARFLGDAGVSTSGIATAVTTTFSLTIPGSATIALVVFNVNASPAGSGATYRIDLCSPGPCAAASFDGSDTVESKLVLDTWDAPAPAGSRRTPGDDSGILLVVADEDGARTLWQEAIDLRDADHAGLSLESFLIANESSASIEISLDGKTWSAIGMPPPADDWLVIDVDLTPYAGQLVHVRMRFDGVAPRFGAARDVWGIRDVRVTRR